MLKYNGKLFFDKPLNDEEVIFLNNWQNKLFEIYEKYSGTITKAEKEKVSSELDVFSGINLSKEQKWTIFFAMSPMIKFTNDYILVKGSHKKGNIREAILAYQHFFLGENPVIAECMNFKFSSSKKIEGFIECKKKKLNEETSWCYLFENNQVYSVEVASKKIYDNHPSLFEKILKEDTFKVKLDKYFPPIIAYANLKKLLNNKEENGTKRRNKI